MSGYRASYGCQDVLLHFINICKKALDDGNVCMALLTDLSKAFDCLPYRLLICKLRAYGLSVNACELLKSYFCERKQRVKLGDKYSDWLGLSKGVPQGSLMGPFIFNIFSNDLLLLLEKKCHVFNCADDTSILCKHRDYDYAYQGWAKSDSKLQALCPDLDHQAFQAFWGNSRKLIEKGKTNILSQLKLYTYGDHVCTLIKIMFLVSSCYFLFKSYSSLMC